MVGTPDSLIATTCVYVLRGDLLCNDRDFPDGQARSELKLSCHRPSGKRASALRTLVRRLGKHPERDVESVQRAPSPRVPFLPTPVRSGETER